MSAHFPKLKYLGGNFKTELDLSNHTTKAVLITGRDADMSKFVKEADLASLKSDIDKLHIGKLEITTVGLSNRGDTVKNGKKCKFCMMN